MKCVRDVGSSPRLSVTTQTDVQCSDSLLSSTNNTKAIYSAHKLQISSSPPSPKKLMKINEPQNTPPGLPPRAPFPQVRLALHGPGPHDRQETRQHDQDRQAQIRE